MTKTYPCADCGRDVTETASGQLPKGATIETSTYPSGAGQTSFAHIIRCAACAKKYAVLR